MIPVIFIVIAWWAGSGAVASIKASRASSVSNTSGTQRAATKSGPVGKPSQAPQSATRPRMAADGVTFGDWQRAAYGRWKRKIRSATFGKHRGSKAADVIGDSLAAVLAGTAVFGLGFASGTAWAGTRWTQRKARGRVNSHGGSTRNGRTRTRPSASGPRPRPGSKPGRPNTPPRGPSAPNDDVFDAELLDEFTPGPAASPYANADDAEVIGTPELLAHYPTIPNGATMADEILNIHALFAACKDIIAAGIQHAEDAKIRAQSAIARAEQAEVRRSGAQMRADQAMEVTTTTAGQIAQMEATAARFGTLNMDQASLASIAAAVESGTVQLKAEQLRAEKAQRAAAIATALALAEQELADAEASSAARALAYVEAVQNMDATVRQHQMPHAEAQVATGNAAAHSSVLAPT